jgi:hypothetical protein
MHICSYNLVYRPPGYIGCYTDKRERILSETMYISNLNTGDACIQQCKNADYRYAGTEVIISNAKKKIDLKINIQIHLSCEFRYFK